MANIFKWHHKDVPVSIKHHPLAGVQHELDRIMNEFYQWTNQISPLSQAAHENLTLFPAIDIIEDEKNFKVEVEMPGMGEEDVKVSVSEGLLTIKGEKETSRQDKNKKYAVREIGYGYYERSIPLPESLETAKASATFKKGMLWVTIPKKEGYAEAPRELKVEKVED